MFGQSWSFCTQSKDKAAAMQGLQRGLLGITCTKGTSLGGVRLSGITCTPVGSSTGRGFGAGYVEFGAVIVQNSLSFPGDSPRSWSVRHHQRSPCSALLSKILCASLPTSLAPQSRPSMLPLLARMRTNPQERKGDTSGRDFVFSNSICPLENERCRDRQHWNPPGAALC